MITTQHTLREQITTNQTANHLEKPCY